MKLLLEKLETIDENKNERRDREVNKVFVPYKVVLRGSEKYGKC